MLLLLILRIVNSPSSKLTIPPASCSLNLPIQNIITVRTGDTISDLLVGAMEQNILMDTLSGCKMEQKSKYFKQHTSKNIARYYYNRYDRKRYSLTSFIFQKNNNQLCQPLSRLSSLIKKKLKKHWPLLLVACVYITREIGRN